jgi:hypothetical protein
MTLLDIALTLDPPSHEDHTHCLASSEDRISNEVFGYASFTPGPDAILVAGWRTGGMDGGNCWGGEARAYKTNVREPELALLDALLLKVAPKISFLEYKQLLTLVESGETTHYEYYGNSTDYAYKYIKLSALETALAEMGYV